MSFKTKEYYWLCRNKETGLLWMPLKKMKKSELTAHLKGVKDVNEIILRSSVPVILESFGSGGEIARVEITPVCKNS